MVYPQSLLSTSDLPSHGCGPSDPALPLVLPSPNRQCRLAQSHHDDDPVAHQTALATTDPDHLIQIASPGIPFESLRNESEHTALSFAPDIIGDARELQSQSVIQLPAEVLDEIFSYAEAATLARLALVCHMFREVATRLLYRHVPSLSLSLTTRCLETLASRPSLAAYTRTCEIGDAGFADANRKGLLPPSFFKLLQRALHNMHRLTELTFLLNGPTSHVLLGAPFRLTKLVSFCDFDATFASWLTEQTNLRDTIFCGKFTTGVTLPVDALPSLRRVAAAPLTLACVVPGRPIREVDLCLVHPWSLNREVLQMAIRTIASSRGPLDSLRVIAHLAESPETVLSAFGVIPTGLNSIRKLVLHAVSGSITEDILSGLPPILAQFSNLKSLKLFSKNTSDALHAAAGTRTLVAAWHAACASLESVTLVGTTLVHNRYYGWVTLRDLAELLTAREQSLQHRAGELCGREVVLDEGGRLGHGLSPELGVDREGSASVVAITA